MPTNESIRQKRCFKCRRWQPVTEFNKCVRNPDGLDGRCRSCNRQWYVANRTQHIKNVARNRNEKAQKNRENLYVYLLDHPCVDCGEADPCVLDFDHVRGKKANAISLMIRECSWKTILAEIEKCDVRCANCHRRITGRRAGWYKATRHDCEPRQTVALTDDLLALLDTFCEEGPPPAEVSPAGSLDGSLWAPRGSNPHASD